MFKDLGFFGVLIFICFLDFNINHAYSLEDTSSTNSLVQVGSSSVDQLTQIVEKYLEREDVKEYIRKERSKSKSIDLVPSSDEEMDKILERLEEGDTSVLVNYSDTQHISAKYLWLYVEKKNKEQPIDPVVRMLVFQHFCSRINLPYLITKIATLPSAAASEEDFNKIVTEVFISQFVPTLAFYGEAYKGKPVVILDIASKSRFLINKQGIKIKIPAFSWLLTGFGTEKKPQLRIQEFRRDFLNVSYDLFDTKEQIEVGKDYNEIIKELVDWMQKHRRVILKSDLNDPSFPFTKEKLKQIFKNQKEAQGIYTNIMKEALEGIPCREYESSTLERSQAGEDSISIDDSMSSVDQLIEIVTKYLERKEIQEYIINAETKKSNQPKKVQFFEEEEMANILKKLQEGNTEILTSFSPRKHISSKYLWLYVEKKNKEQPIDPVVRLLVYQYFLSNLYSFHTYHAYANVTKISSITSSKEVFDKVIKNVFISQFTPMYAFYVGAYQKRDLTRSDIRLMSMTNKQGIKVTIPNLSAFKNSSMIGNYIPITNEELRRDLLDVSHDLFDSEDQIESDNDYNEVKKELVDWMREHRRAILKSDLNDPSFPFTKEKLKQIFKNQNEAQDIYFSIMKEAVDSIPSKEYISDEEKEHHGSQDSISFDYSLSNLDQLIQVVDKYLEREDVKEYIKNARTPSSDTEMEKILQELKKGNTSVIEGKLYSRAQHISSKKLWLYVERKNKEQPIDLTIRLLVFQHFTEKLYPSGTNLVSLTDTLSSNSKKHFNDLIKDMLISQFIPTIAFFHSARNAEPLSPYQLYYLPTLPSMVNDQGIIVNIPGIYILSVRWKEKRIKVTPEEIRKDFLDVSKDLYNDEDKKEEEGEDYTDIRNELVDWMRENRRVLLKSDLNDPSFPFTKEKLKRIFKNQKDAQNIYFTIMKEALEGIPSREYGSDQVNTIQVSGDSIRIETINTVLNHFKKNKDKVEGPNILATESQHNYIVPISLIQDIVDKIDYLSTNEDIPFKFPTRISLTKTSDNLLGGKFLTEENNYYNKTYAYAWIYSELTNANWQTRYTLFVLFWMKSLNSFDYNSTHISDPKVQDALRNYFIVEFLPHISKACFDAGIPINQQRNRNIMSKPFVPSKKFFNTGLADGQKLQFKSLPFLHYSNFVRNRGITPFQSIEQLIELTLKLLGNDPASLVPRERAKEDTTLLNDVIKNYLTQNEDLQIILQEGQNVGNKNKVLAWIREHGTLPTQEDLEISTNNLNRYQKEAIKEYIKDWIISNHSIQIELVDQDIEGKILKEEGKTLKISKSLFSNIFESDDLASIKREIAIDMVVSWIRIHRKLISYTDFKETDNLIGLNWDTFRKFIELEDQNDIDQFIAESIMNLLSKSNDKGCDYSKLVWTQLDGRVEAKAKLKEQIRQRFKEWILQNKRAINAEDFGSRKHQLPVMSANFLKLAFGTISMENIQQQVVKDLLISWMIENRRPLTQNDFVQTQNSSDDVAAIGLTQFETLAKISSQDDWDRFVVDAVVQIHKTEQYTKLCDDTIFPKLTADQQSILAKNYKIVILPVNDSVPTQQVSKLYKQNPGINKNREITNQHDPYDTGFYTYLNGLRGTKNDPAYIDIKEEWIEDFITSIEENRVPNIWKKMQTPEGIKEISSTLKDLKDKTQLKILLAETWNRVRRSQNITCNTAFLVFTALINLISNDDIPIDDSYTKVGDRYATTIQNELEALLSQLHSDITIILDNNEKLIGFIVGAKQDLVLGDNLSWFLKNREEFSTTIKNLAFQTKDIYKIFLHDLELLYKKERVEFVWRNMISSLLSQPFEREIGVMDKPNSTSSSVVLDGFYLIVSTHSTPKVIWFTIRDQPTLQKDLKWMYTQWSLQLSGNDPKTRNRDNILSRYLRDKKPKLPYTASLSRMVEIIYPIARQIQQLESCASVFKQERN